MIAITSVECVPAIVSSSDIIVLLSFFLCLSSIIHLIEQRLRVMREVIEAGRGVWYQLIGLWVKIYGTRVSYNKMIGRKDRLRKA